MSWNNSRHYGFCVDSIPFSNIDHYLANTWMIRAVTRYWVPPQGRGTRCIVCIFHCSYVFTLSVVFQTYVLVIAEITTDLFVNEADFAGWPTMFSCFTILHLRSPVGWHARYINICNTGSWEHVKVSDVCPKSIGQCEQVAPVVFDYLPCQFTSQSAARVLYSPVKITPENSRLSCNVVLSTFTLHLVNLLPAQLLTVLHDYWLRDLNTLRFLQE